MSTGRLATLCLCLAALSAVGCTPGAYTGGGFATSALGEKATFGFNGQARDRDGDTVVDAVTGQFQFKDHTNGVAFHGVLVEGGIAPVQLGKFDGNGNIIFSELAFLGRGTYEPIPRNLGPGGTFEVVLADFGQEGPNEGDVLVVNPTSGIFTPYANSFSVEGGNLTKHDR